MAHTWGKLMQERKTKKDAAGLATLAAAAWAAAGTGGLGEKGENWGQSQRARPSKSQAPRWKGRD